MNSDGREVGRGWMVMGSVLQARLGLKAGVSAQLSCYDWTACTIRLDLQKLVTRLYLDGLILGAM